MLHPYKDLIVWQRSVELVVAIYELTEQFPREEMYGLANELRRAAISIPSNIAQVHYSRVDSLLEEVVKMLNKIIKNFNPNKLMKLES